MKGTTELAKTAASEGDFERLFQMQQHGADILGFRDTANQENTLLHFAVKTDNIRLLKFLKDLQTTDFDAKNANGETALHMCCGQSANEELAKYLVMCGASIHAKNALGDTPVTLATRFGHTELAVLLNTSTGSSQKMGMTATSGFMSVNSMGQGKPPSGFSPYDHNSQYGAATSGSTYGAASSQIEQCTSP